MNVRELINQLAAFGDPELEVRCREPYYGNDMFVENVVKKEFNQHVTYLVLNGYED